MAVDHYENFPVASVLVPRRLRTAVIDIYRFARSADDIADEGQASAEERLSALQHYSEALDVISGKRTGPFKPEVSDIFVPLQASIDRHGLPVQPFHDLLSAFSQDIQTTRYRDDEQLLDYCRRSANPVGHLMLHLYGAASAQNLAASDAICTGLQLTNFWQDVAVDWQKARVYLPQTRLAQFEVTEQDIAAQKIDVRWENLMCHQVQQARQLLLQGRDLPKRLPLRLALELRMVIQGGLRILERLDALNYDIYNQRPTLKARDWLVVVWRALTHSNTHQPSDHA